MAPYGSSRKHASSSNKISSKRLPPSSPTNNKDILSSRRHNMEYVTTDGVFLRTGHADKKTWYLLCLKELWDNCIDFLWKYYQGAAAGDVIIETEITKINDSMLHVKVRNTNSKNIPVFQNLSAIFDYDMRYGSKQNQRIISRGMLGDAKKQILSWPYVLIHTTKEGNGTGFVDRQWDKPLIIRHNGLERHVFLHVDKGNQTIHAEIRPVSTKLSHTDTEIELTWPIPDDIDLDIHDDIEAFCRLYPILTTDVSFKFRLVDNSKDKPNLLNTTTNPNRKFQEVRNSYGETTCWSEVTENMAGGDGRSIVTAAELDKILSSPARKAAINIEYPALHPIATGWNNISSIYAYEPEEFVTSITSVHDKQSTRVYDVLKTFREGSNLKKTEDNQMSIAELMLDPHKHKKIEVFFHQLRSVLDASKRLSLPYPVNDFNERKKPLVDRIVQLYPDQLNPDKAVYKAVHGFHDGGSNGIRYPFMFEIVAVPYNDESLDNNRDRPTKFFGYVNYSISPKGNKFEGKYEWDDKQGYPVEADDITDMLQQLKFSFYEYASARTKLPCIIVANLVSPRIDYHGHDKSRIDTAPFAETILKAVRKMAEDIQTFQAAGWSFYGKRKREFIASNADKKFTTEGLLKEFLQQRMRGER